MQSFVGRWFNTFTLRVITKLERVVDERVAFEVMVEVMVGVMRG